MILLLLYDISFEMRLTVDAVKNSRRREQRDTVMQLINCKAELNMTMLKVILFSRKMA